jgi:hypothetical protein
MTLLERVDVDRIGAEAEQISFRRVALTVLLGFFLLIGWAAGTICRLLWAAVAWSFAAVKVGWEDAQRPREELRPRRTFGPS